MPPRASPDPASPAGALPYLAYERARGRPHVVVDGAPQAGTVLTLSHWPGSGTPPTLRADTSAEIALRALDHPDLWRGAEAVTNNHPDVDGLLGVWVLVDPPAAAARAERVVAVATAGDFGVARDDGALGAATALQALMGDAMGRGADPYVEVLPMVAGVLDRPERFEDRWRDTVATFRDGRAAIASGTVTLEEVPALDLAVLTVPPGVAVPDPVAVHSSTERVRVLVVHGDAVEYHDRYETWVQYASRPVARRVDLTPLAVQLTASEPAGATWRYDGVEGILPRLAIASGASGLAPAEVRARLEAFLVAAPPAWDPFATRPRKGGAA